MRASLVALAALALAAGASAQGIGDVAARERAKRQAASTSTEKRAFDNVDLEQGRPPGAKSDAPADKPQPAQEPAEGASPEEAMRARVQAAEEAVQAAEKEVVRLEGRQQEILDMLNPMSVKYVYGQARSMDATAEEQRLKDELAALPARIEAAKKAVIDAQRAVADARRPIAG
jgi:hypothetical protein